MALLTPLSPHNTISHFANLHGTGGGGYEPPRVWLLSELELRLKNQSVACHETKPLTPGFKVLGQPVTSEVRSMTQKWQKMRLRRELRI